MKGKPCAQGSLFLTQCIKKQFVLYIFLLNVYTKLGSCLYIFKWVIQRYVYFLFDGNYFSFFLNKCEIY